MSLDWLFKILSGGAIPLFLYIFKQLGNHSERIAQSEAFREGMKADIAELKTLSKETNSLIIDIIRNK